MVLSKGFFLENVTKLIIIYDLANYYFVTFKGRFGMPVGEKFVILHIINYVDNSGICIGCVTRSV